MRVEARKGESRVAMRGAEYVGALALVVWALEAVGVLTQASLLASALREGTLRED